MATFSTITPVAAGWECYPAYHGLAVRSSSPAATRFLPTDADDRVADDVALSFVLTDDEYALLTTRTAVSLSSAVAATYYGPSEQDKTSNEDFALAAVVPGANGSSWSYAAVADGVSTKTFWAARTSRLVCLIAFRELRSFVERVGTLSDADLEHFRKSLTAAVRAGLEAERSLLLNLKKVPSRWSADYFARYHSRDELWFNSTLLIAALGEWNGFVMWTGDGGIHLRKRNATRPQWSDSVVMASTDDSRIESCVSLGMEADQFRLARIGYNNSSRIEVYLGSDGVDRTLQRTNGGGYPSLSFRDPVEAARMLRELGKSNEAERDNFSVARITHDVSADVISTLTAAQPEEPRPAIAALTLRQAGPEPTIAGRHVDPTPRSVSEQQAQNARTVGTPGFIYCLFFIFGGVSGFGAGLFLMSLVHTLEQPTAGGPYRPIHRARVLPKSSTQLPQLVIDDAVKTALKHKTPSEPIRGFIIDCIAAAKAQPGVFTVVAYADRSNAADREDCRVNAAVAIARSQVVAAWIQEQLKAEDLYGRSSISAAQRVCDPPSPDILITDVRARRFALVRGTLANCDCK